MQIKSILKYTFKGIKRRGTGRVSPSLEDPTNLPNAVQRAVSHKPAEAPNTTTISIDVEDVDVELDRSRLL